MKKLLPLLLLALSASASLYSQPTGNANYSSKFIKVNGIATHYLDFGGAGMPVILVHSEAWDAFTYQDFGPLLADSNRVLAVTRPGYGQSGQGSYAVADQGDHLLAFAEALGFEKVIFIGNSSVSAELTYLAETYPGRLAGIVYLSGPATPWLDIHSTDPNRAWEMYVRASPAADTAKNDRELIMKARASYRPRHFSNDSVKIAVPALAFTASNGRLGYEKGVAALLLVGSPLMATFRRGFPPSPLRTQLDRMALDSTYRYSQLSGIQDSLARAYFLRLAGDSALQQEVYQFHLESVYPATLRAQDKLIRAYGEQLQRHSLEVPQVVGYEYRDAPGLIINPLREFLQQLRN